MKQYFPHFTLFCSGISVLLAVFVFCHLFIRSCGGPFPQRTRGPFARHEHYQLGEMPKWENAIQITESGKTTTELFIEGFDTPIPRIQFGNPPQGATEEVRP